MQPPPPPGNGDTHKTVNIGQQEVEGGVHFHFGADSAERQNLHKPPRNLPPRQETFAGRESELDALHRSLAHESLVGVTQQAAVHSHGGVGKTSLAIEYGWRRLEDYPGGVFFLSCERAPVPPLAELAPYLGIHADGNAEETAALVKTHLEAHGPALLILDNVESQAQWRDGRWNRLLPQAPCRRLVTTRAPQLAGARMIPLERLSAEDGLDLLANFRADVREESDAAAAIVEWFDGLAVGLTVVGVYMQMSSGLSWQRYAEDLQRRGLEVVRDTEEVVDEVMEYEGRAGSVFDDVLRALPAAERRALKFAALLPEDNVFAPWLLDLLDADGVEMPSRPGYTEAPAQQVVDSLASRQLLRPRGEGERVLSLHRVLRRHLAEQLSEATREFLFNRIGELAEKRGEASRTMITDVELRSELTPLRALAEALDEVGRTSAGISLTNWIVEILRYMGRYTEARTLVDRFFARRDAAGPQQALILLQNSAVTLHDQGELPEARRRMEQAISIQEQHLQPSHRTLATSYSNLALILKAQGELPEARRRMEQAITIDEQHFQPDHPTLAIRYSNLAMILKDQGELVAARKRMEQALQSDEQNFQPDHPKLAIRYSNLGSILVRQGELPEARRLLQQAIAIDERNLQPDHPTLATDYNNLGDVERASGDTGAACEFYRRADVILRKHFPPQHPHRQIINKKLALFCRNS